MSDNATTQELRFAIDGVDEAGSMSISPSYRVRLLDGNEGTVLLIDVPAKILEQSVLSQVNLLLSMSPEGTISIDRKDGHPAMPNWQPTNISDLVMQAIEPAMLEDETNVEIMLQTLKQRLQASLAATEEAISKIERMP